MPGPPPDPPTGIGSGIDAVWSRAAVPLGARPDAAARDGKELADAYAQPHRRYHDGSHVAAVLRDSAWLAGLSHLTEDEQAILALAVCAHDVVYDATPGTDEHASAEWARSRLVAAGAGTPTAERVAGLVLSTMGHEADVEDVVATALLDADLAILAAPAPEYEAYVRAVRAEYSAVSEAQWRQGRTDVLRALAARPQLYRSAPARDRWEAAARVNVRAELAELDPA